MSLYTFLHSKSVCVYDQSKLSPEGWGFSKKKHSEEDFAKGTSLVQNNIQPQNRSNSMIVKEKENAKKAFFLRMTSGSFSGMIKTKKYQNHRK